MAPACRQKQIHESKVSSVGDFSRDTLILLHIISHTAKWEVWIIVYYTNIKHRCILMTVISITASRSKVFHKSLTTARAQKATSWCKNRKKHFTVMNTCFFIELLWSQSSPAVHSLVTVYYSCCLFPGSWHFLPVFMSKSATDQIYFTPNVKDPHTQADEERWTQKAERDVITYII